MPAPFFFLCYTAAAALIFGVERGGLALLAPVALVFGALPAFDELLRDDWTQAGVRESRSAYDLPLHLFVPVHSEHHFDPTRPYERLPPGEEAPQLPAGYASMLLVALVPPLWFRIMNPRAEAVRQEQPAAAS